LESISATYVPKEKPLRIQGLSQETRTAARISRTRIDTPLFSWPFFSLISMAWTRVYVCVQRIEMNTACDEAGRIQA
jgi:hypothetical protein